MPPFAHVLDDEQIASVATFLRSSWGAQAAPISSADVMRWLYCRSNPAANLNFGPTPINEVRANFIIKLWNCYGLFCNYAALDGFDPLDIFGLLVANLGWNIQAQWSAVLKRRGSAAPSTWTATRPSP